MTELLSFTIDKFTFTIPSDRLYHPDGIWLLARDGRLVIGVTDYFQQNSGDIAFCEVEAPGTTIKAGESLARIETIKVDVEVASPLTGTVVAINERLELEAEIINQDPYGEGWLAVVEPADLNQAQAAFMSPDAYLAHSRVQAEAEVGKP